MKSLLIDVGNTNSKYAVYENNKISVIDRESALSNMEVYSELICSSVSSDSDVDTIKKDFKGKVTEVQTEAVSFEIQNAYKNYQNLGIDRWLAVLGAEKAFPNLDLIIVDAGTAMTVDALSAKKQHLGGWIIPGLSLMQSAIVDRAPGVFSGEVQQRETFGTDTPSALFSGCFFALTSAIEKAAILLTKANVNSKPIVLLTGGDAQKLQNGLEIPSQLIPDLVFKGLARFSESENG